MTANTRPEDGIAPGTKWADIPGSWACPDCGDFHYARLVLAAPCPMSRPSCRRGR